MTSPVASVADGGFVPESLSVVVLVLAPWNRLPDAVTGASHAVNDKAESNAVTGASRAVAQRLCLEGRHRLCDWCLARR